MRKINPFLLMPFATLCIHNAALAAEFTASPFGKVYSSVSNKEPNIINVKNDKVVAISAKTGAVIGDEQTADGSIVFSTTETKPFSILVETEKGFNFTVIASPNKTEQSSSIVINNLADKGNVISDDVLQSGAWQNSYSGVVSHVFSELLNNRVPNGFVETRNREYDEPVGLKGQFKIKRTDAWVGLGMRVVRLDITNISPHTVELNERNLWTKNVMAVTFYPNVSVFPPNTRVFAYVMMKGGE